MTASPVQPKLWTRYRHYYPALVILLVSLAALFLAWQDLNWRHQQRLQEYFAFETQRITGNISERMDLHGQTLRSAAGLFAASNEVTREDWRAFVEMLELDRSHPGAQGVGYAVWIPSARLEQHIAAVRRQGFPDYIVNPLDSREGYSSIIYLEPFSGRNLRAFGYDMFSDPLRRGAMERARDNGNLAYTGKVFLIQETEADLQAGMLAYFPVYRNGSIPQTVEQRRAALLGWVYMPYRMNDLLHTILGRDLLALRLEIFDQDDLSAEGLLYDSQSKLTSVAFMPRDDAMTLNLRLNLGGHFWTLRYSALPEFSKTAKFEPPWVEVLALVFISFLLFFITWAYINVRRNAEIARQLTESLRQSESRFRSLFENSPVAYLALDRQGCLLDVNPQLCDLLDYGSEELIGRKLFEFISPDTGQDFQLKLQMLNHYGLLECELSLLGKSGHTLTVILDGRLQGNKVRPAVIHCILTNITERKRAEDKLQLAARVFSEAHEGITITDAAGNIIDANPTFCAITGYTREEVIGRNHSILQSGKHDAAFYKDLWQTLQTEGCWQGEIWNRKKSGELYVELLTISAMRNRTGEILNYVGLFSDITQAKLQQQELERMAHHDPLTQLPNRILFNDRFRQALARCKRDNTLLGVVYMDLDGFKQVNDQLGHEAGDMLLIEVATRIKAGLREDDTVCRLGGDEFALLVGGIESRAQCEQAVQRIHQAISQPYRIAGQEMVVGVSSGITLCPSDTGTPAGLLSHADQAMYLAKQHGRGCYEFFELG
ncbi:CHASE domain-containing protein [Methylomonas sp. 2BW1-5-20]|uniref:CHASE domain-containing protein n=1 Tax=Methylomonas sp. 2BW1-5-20 TaxID=3376686 RepID=UPI00405202CD